MKCFEFVSVGLVFSPTVSVSYRNRYRLHALIGPFSSPLCPKVVAYSSTLASFNDSPIDPYERITIKLRRLAGLPLIHSSCLVMT